MTEQPPLFPDLAECAAARPAVAPPVEGGWHGSATYSPCGRYRYTLTRVWGRDPAGGGRMLPFVMLNPSTATEFVLDPTLRRCAGFAGRLGYDGMVILNLFAFRATDPRVMKAQADPVGPDNDAVLAQVAADSDKVIAGWGTHGAFRSRDRHVLDLLAGTELYRLGPATKDGHPRHPLYLPGNAPLTRHH